MFYVTKNGFGKLTPELKGGILTSVSGNTPELGHFKLSLIESSENKLPTYLSTHLDQDHNARDIVSKNLHYRKVVK